MCDIVFEKAKCQCWAVNITSVYAEAAVRSVLYKRCYGKFLRILKKTSVPEYPFWCLLVNFAKLVRTPFLQNSNRRLLLIIAVSIVVKGLLANKTVGYDTKALREKCIVNIRIYRVNLRI